MNVSTGIKAPDFELKDANGISFRLSEHIGKSPIVLFFYPKDFTPGCTAEACSFRDQYQAFVDAGAMVIGISGDSEKSHQRFAKHFNLPYTLLSDSQGKVSSLFGVQRRFMGLLPGRETFVLDIQGTCILHFNNLSASGHVHNALKALKTSALKSMHVYPLVFHPIFKERIWGGSKLSTKLLKHVKGDLIGESWEISGVPGSESVVSQGAYAGKSLAELCSLYPEQMLGSEVVTRFGIEFPLLIKFIDAKQDLSIQLHPDDQLARRRHGSFGKTEMWYVMDADPGAQLIVGFKRPVRPEEYQEALAAGTLTDLLHYQDVKSGDTVFIPAGKIHAIGAGILLAEIQQSSDVTYRVYDFDRKDAEGNLRELHTDLALDAMDFTCRDDFNVSYDRQRVNAPEMLVSSPYFVTRYIKLTQDKTFDLTQRSSLTILICVSGTLEVIVNGTSVSLQVGQTVLIPAAAPQMEIKSSDCTLLEVSI